MHNTSAKKDPTPIPAFAPWERCASTRISDDVGAAKRAVTDGVASGGKPLSSFVLGVGDADGVNGMSNMLARARAFLGSKSLRFLDSQYIATGCAKSVPE